MNDSADETPALGSGTRFFHARKTRVDSIESMGLTGDLVVCMQTIGFNKKFNSDAAVQAVDKLIAATRSGVALIFNVRD